MVMWCGEDDVVIRPRRVLQDLPWCPQLRAGRSATVDIYSLPGIGMAGLSGL